MCSVGVFHISLIYPGIPPLIPMRRTSRGYLDNRNRELVKALVRRYLVETISQGHWSGGIDDRRERYIPEILKLSDE